MWRNKIPASPHWINILPVFDRYVLLPVVVSSL